ncbi:hydroxymethylbilane synthase [Alicyclobacillus sp. SO9]|uniref:hydroxymethylbilane synthase n=1 Tax=Alicyclobacillus sp. SO9 TaxID=2665646 RepID=UPI0018E7733C|nr:hydroxymethylbilane synthase [Alicyclobacillus sp. SO9]QQE77024.1 hydroxymethylbilane synthase [Alicyclobacillus sp. SO9]
MRTIRVASRKSALAMTQTKWVISKMQQLAPDTQFVIVPVTTRGDTILNVTLSKVGGKGLFVSEIEQLMLSNEADLAVHSMKDMPARLADGLALGGVPEREDPRDAFLSRDEVPWQKLPQGAVVGTSSLRRMAQIRALRPDIRVESIRGNIDTRIAKMERGDFDAILLAASGLARMGWSKRITQYLEPDDCLPAVGQGILGIECRKDDDYVLELLARLTDEAAQTAALAERSLLAALDGSCQVPLAGFATVDKDGDIHLKGLVAAEDGTTVIRAEDRGRNASELGQKVAARLRDQGAEEILNAVRVSDS